MKKRDDGSISSVNPVDAMGMVHGVRLTYYSDGKSYYSKVSFFHGKKQGPAIFYYRNGQVFKHTGFQFGKHHGPARKYYKNGSLMAEYEYDQGMMLPGLKEYKSDGSLITDYEDLEFREIDLRSRRNRIDLEISCPIKSSRIVYYVVKTGTDGKVSYVLQENKHGFASIPIYIQPGTPPREIIKIRAEIPTELGNVWVKDYTYQLGS